MKESGGCDCDKSCGCDCSCDKRGYVWDVVGEKLCSVGSSGASGGEVGCFIESSHCHAAIGFILRSRLSSSKM